MAGAEAQDREAYGTSLHTKVDTCGLLPVPGQQDLKEPSPLRDLPFGLAFRKVVNRPYLRRETAFLLSMASRYRLSTRALVSRLQGVSPGQNEIGRRPALQPKPDVRVRRGKQPWTFRPEFGRRHSCRVRAKDSATFFGAAQRRPDSHYGEPSGYLGGGPSLLLPG